MAKKAINSMIRFHTRIWAKPTIARTTENPAITPNSRASRVNVVACSRSDDRSQPARVSGRSRRQGPANAPHSAPMNPAVPRMPRAWPPSLRMKVSFWASEPMSESSSARCPPWGVTRRVSLIPYSSLSVTSREAASSLVPWTRKKLSVG